VQVACISGDVRSAPTILPEILNVLEKMPPLHGIFCVVGCIDDNDTPDRPDLIASLTEANFIGPSAIVGALAPRVSKGGFIVGIGSIAASRGRRRNSAYAAAKGALHLYFQSLAHALWRNVLVQFYSAGYLDTNLAFGRRLPMAPASPRTFASHIARKIKLGEEGDFYFPWYWRYVSLVVTALPRVVFRKLDF
jgi:NAD(P)-dependent dehydrogenase (short-subunit alcohol dehydrogenase family)